MPCENSGRKPRSGAGCHRRAGVRRSCPQRLPSQAGAEWLAFSASGPVMRPTKTWGECWRSSEGANEKGAVSSNIVHIRGLGKLLLVCSRVTPSPGPPRLEKAPVAVHPCPQGGEGSKFKLLLPSPLWGRGAGGEGVELGTVSLSEQHWVQPPASEGVRQRTLDTGRATLRRRKQSPKWAPHREAHEVQP